MKVDLVGPHFINHFPHVFETKHHLWVTLEQNIIVKIVMPTMDIFLMMGQSQQEKDIVIMVYV